MKHSPAAALRSRRLLPSGCALLALVSASAVALAAPPADATRQPAPAPAAPAAAAPAKPATAPPAAGARGAAVARVNGTVIYQTDLDSAIASFMQSNPMPEPVPEDRKKEIRKSMLEGLIGTELLYQRAVTVGTQVPQSEVDQALRRTRDSMGEQVVQAEMTRRGMSEADLASLVKQNLTVQRLIKETILDPMVIQEAEIRQFYTEHPDEMKRPAGVDVSHILVRWTPADGPQKREAARQRIEQALKRATAGEDFAALAKEYSEDGSAESGGHLGMIYPGQTVPPFEEAAFKLKEAETSGVVESQFGFHLIRAGARQAEGIAAFEEVRGPVSEYLRQRRSQAAIEKLVTDLRAAAKVELL